MKSGPGFTPEEIIFCPTSACNLKCAHCFVTQNGKSLGIAESLEFLESCIQGGTVGRVGFSGGEPFLNTEFVCEISKKAVDAGLMFDRLMTNGVWWKDEDDLESRLEKVRDAGFDGKIGLSWDSFHGQSLEKIASFVNACHEIFGSGDCVEILSVIRKDSSNEDCGNFLSMMKGLAGLTGCDSVEDCTDRKTGRGTIRITDRKTMKSICAFRFDQSFMPEEPPVWNDSRWFAEDYCQSTGNVLYVHSDGSIAPCCGFANELEKLKIGSVKDSFDAVMEKASANGMVRTCYVEGLSTKIKDMKKKKILPEGKCADMCQFCAWMCLKKETT